MSQAERMEAIEKFQRGEVDYLLATDLVARGLDINNVKSVLNFSFPTEPKRYLHRIGRTARAGSSGVAVTLCNDEERKDIKKLSRKLNQNISPYILQPRLVQEMHEFITNEIDPVIHEIQTELIQDRELLNAYRDAQRAENIIKHKKEIMSRPRAEWHNNRKEKLELKRESFKDLKTISEKFEGSLSKMSEEQKDKKKKRETKYEAKAAREAKKQAGKGAPLAKGASKFSSDFESDKKASKKAKMGQQREEFGQKGKLQKKGQDNKKEEKGGYTGKKFVEQVTHKSFKGKRNSPGAKMNNFRGERSLTKMKHQVQQKRVKTK